MKNSYIFIALAMVSVLFVVSCKNINNKANEPTQKDVQEMKQALADSVLAKIDAFVVKYWNAYDKSFSFQAIGLTDKEKFAKPDYLLDPAVANTLVTKSQKINALAMYVMDIALCKSYEISYDYQKEAAIKLATDLNVPFDMEYITSNNPASEIIRAIYKACKERGDVSLFWQFEHAVVTEGIYILSQDPELFLSKITQEQWAEWSVVKRTRMAAIKELAQYDEEISQLLERFLANTPLDSDEDNDRVDQSIEAARHYYFAYKDKYAAWRNSMLQ